MSPMHIARKAFYNSLSMKWQSTPSISVEPWQVEDYRMVSLEDIFSTLNSLGFSFDSHNFILDTDDAETPEDFIDMLVDRSSSTIDVDHIYLLIFELWRRLLPQKLSFSIFCDELDYHINLYDKEESSGEELQDLLSFLEDLLNRNRDEGETPHEIFEFFLSSCAFDIETFLYDFISENIEGENYTYASDLVEAFYDFVMDIKWFDLLRARILFPIEHDVSFKIFEALVDIEQDTPDLGFNFELLLFAANNSSRQHFFPLLHHTIPLLEAEEDFTDLIETCIEYYTLRDNEELPEYLSAILEKRQDIPSDTTLATDDEDLLYLQSLVEKPSFSTQ
jgi:hypothetical protein